MAVRTSADVDEAARQLRESDEPGWGAARSGVVAAVRRVARRSWPVAADVEDFRDPALRDPALRDPALRAPGSGPVRVGDQVIRAALARGVAEHACSLQSALLDVDGTRLLRVRLGVVLGYGPDLEKACEVVRSVAVRVLVELLGSAGQVAVDLVVVDLTAGDPRAQ